jgi:hypothetical protein
LFLLGKENKQKGSVTEIGIIEVRVDGLMVHMIEVLVENLEISSHENIFVSLGRKV